MWSAARNLWPAACNTAVSSSQSVARSPQSDCGPQPAACNLWPAARNLSVARNPQPTICDPQPTARNAICGPHPAACNLATLKQKYMKFVCFQHSHWFITMVSTFHPSQQLYHVKRIFSDFNNIFLNMVWIRRYKQKSVCPKFKMIRTFSSYRMYDYVYFIVLNKVSCPRLFCENCSHFILKWFQPNSFGKVCFYRVHHKHMQKIHILKILSVAQWIEHPTLNTWMTARRGFESNWCQNLCDTSCAPEQGTLL